MAKLTRREFLKYVTLLGAISPIFDIDLIRNNLSNFTVDQLKAISEIQDIKRGVEIQSNPYVLFIPEKWLITFKDGTQTFIDEREMNYRYGGINSYLMSRPDVENYELRARPDHPANWND